MRLLIIAIALIILSGCSVKGNLPRFPVPPKALTDDCKDLMLIPSGEEKLSEVLKVVTTNYERYHECRIKVQLWNEWYSKQKTIYERIK